MQGFRGGFKRIDAVLRPFNLGTPPVPWAFHVRGVPKAVPAFPLSFTPKKKKIMLQIAAWAPPLGISWHPHGLQLRHRHQRVVAVEGSVLMQLDDLYRILLVDGPIELEYAPQQVADQLVGLAANRPVVGVRVTPAGWSGITLASLWSCYSPAGLVAYLRDTRARGEELPMHLDWVPEYVWPQRRSEEMGEVQAETGDTDVQMTKRHDTQSHKVE